MSVLIIHGRSLQCQLCFRIASALIDRVSVARPVRRGGRGFLVHVVRSGFLVRSEIEASLGCRYVLLFSNPHVSLPVWPLHVHPGVCVYIFQGERGLPGDRGPGGAKGMPGVSGDQGRMGDPGVKGQPVRDRIQLNI